MAKVSSGVFPSHLVDFKINNLTVADIETLELSIDGNVEEWNSFEMGGWSRRLLTGKALSISASGKRNVGDEGNDFVASKAYVNGQEATVPVSIDFPDGSKLEFQGVLNVTNPGLGETRAVAPLEFEVQSDGKPTFTPATAEAAKSTTTTK